MLLLECSPTHDHLNMMSNSISVSAAARLFSAEGQFKAVMAGEMHPAAVRKREKELLISRVYKSGAVEVINDHHHSQIISCDMCPFPSWAGGRDHWSFWLIKRAPWVSLSQPTFVSRQGQAGERQGWGVMSHLTAGSSSCVWEANNITAILPPVRFVYGGWIK